MKKDSKLESFANAVYADRHRIVKYLIAALLCGGLRFASETFFSLLFDQPSSDSAFLAWCVWTAAFYPCMKLFVFKKKENNVYDLLRNAIIYVLLCAVLWLTRQLLVTGAYVLTNNGAAALAVGGALNELLCMLLMFRAAFSEK